MTQKNHTSHSHKKNGFSLIEVLVAIGLFSVLTFVVASFFNDSFKSQKKLDMKGQISAVGNQITAMLGSDLCMNGIFVEKATPDNRIGVVGALPATVQLESLRLNPGGGAAGTRIITRNTDVAPGLQVQNLRLILDSALPDTAPFQRYSAQIIVDYTSSNPNIVVPLRAVTYPILLRIDTAAAGAVVSCSYTSGMTENSLCENLHGGIYDSSSTPRCRIPRYNFSAGPTLNDLGLAGQSTLAFEALAPGRGLSIYGANAELNLFANVGEFTNPASTPASLRRNGADLEVRAPGQMVVVTPMSVQGALNVAGNAAVTGNVTATNFSGTSVTTTGGITFGGNLSASGGGNATGFNRVSAQLFTTTSDETLKTSKLPLEKQLDKILKVNLYSYQYKDDSTQRTHFGVMAQEIESLYPELVYEDPTSSKLTVNYQEMVPLMLKAIQELHEKNQKLEKQILELKNKTSR